MKRIALLVCAAVAVIGLSCFDDGPSKPRKTDDNGDLSPYSGTFQLDYTLERNSCQVPAPPSALVSIKIKDETIDFGGFKGVWDESTKTGAGVSPEVRIPVQPPACYAYYTFTFSIVYDDLDHFHGTYEVSTRKDEACPNPEPCGYLYRISGSR